MPEEPADKSRASKVLAIVGALVGVVAVTVAVLTYLRDGPSSLAEFQGQVDVVCKSAEVREPPIGNAIVADGWNKDLFIEILGSVPDVDRVTLRELRALRPPDEIKARHASGTSLLEKLIADVEAYSGSLEALPAREWKKRFPDWPGDESAVLATSRQYGAALVSLSGGRCQRAEPQK